MKMARHKKHERADPIARERDNCSGGCLPTLTNHDQIPQAEAFVFFDSICHLKTSTPGKQGIKTAIHELVDSSRLQSPRTLFVATLHG